MPSPLLSNDNTHGQAYSTQNISNDIANINQTYTNWREPRSTAQLGLPLPLVRRSHNCHGRSNLGLSCGSGRHAIHMPNANLCVILVILSLMLLFSFKAWFWWFYWILISWEVLMSGEELQCLVPWPCLYGFCFSACVFFHALLSRRCPVIVLQYNLWVLGYFQLGGANFLLSYVVKKHFVVLPKFGCAHFCGSANWNMNSWQATRLSKLFYFGKEAELTQMICKHMFLLSS